MTVREMRSAGDLLALLRSTLNVTPWQEFVQTRDLVGFAAIQVVCCPCHLNSFVIRNLVSRSNK